MNTLRRNVTWRRRSGATGSVVDLDRARIERALASRTRYRYVHPRVLPGERGWNIVSPNCSRNIDPAGGDIDIAWLEPAGGGLWNLHARDHALKAWRCAVSGIALAQALERLCGDAAREFWP